MIIRHYYTRYAIYSRHLRNHLCTAFDHPWGIFQFWSLIFLFILNFYHIDITIKTKNRDEGNYIIVDLAITVKKESDAGVTSLIPLTWNKYWIPHATYSIVCLHTEYLLTIQLLMYGEGEYGSFDNSENFFFTANITFTIGWL